MYELGRWWALMVPRTGSHSLLIALRQAGAEKVPKHRYHTCARPPKSFSLLMAVRPPISRLVSWWRLLAHDPKNRWRQFETHKVKNISLAGFLEWLSEGPPSLYYPVSQTGMLEACETEREEAFIIPVDPGRISLQAGLNRWRYETQINADVKAPQKWQVQMLRRKLPETAEWMREAAELAPQYEALRIEDDSKLFEYAERDMEARSE